MYNGRLCGAATHFPWKARSWTKGVSGVADMNIDPKGAGVERFATKGINKALHIYLNPLRSNTCAG